MTALGDLPPYRLAKLLWRYAHQGPAAVEERVREADGRPCHIPAPPPGPPGPATALPGDDGRLHLLRGTVLLCAAGPASGGGWPHRQHCGWTEDDGGPRDWRGGGFDASLVWGSREITWRVRQAGAVREAAEVPRRRRCRGDGRTFTHHSWPPPPARTPAIRRLRAVLTDALGPGCHLCGHYPGAMVDHDHENGLVRGLLCGLCNAGLEDCPHLTGCPKADYLATPPAAALHLPYPVHQEWRTRPATRQRKIELLGFDPFEGLPLRMSRDQNAP